MKPTIYIETTVISYFTARSSRDLIVTGHQQITSEWWELSLPKFRPYISQFVLNEIAAGDKSAAAARIKAVEKFAILEMNSEIADLAKTYYRTIKIPQKAMTDAIHLALAVWHNVDYLVSWNCSHIVSGRVRRLLEQINNERNISTPVICTPEELMEV